MKWDDQYIVTTDTLHTVLLHEKDSSQFPQCFVSSFKCLAFETKVGYYQGEQVGSTGSQFEVGL